MVERDIVFEKIKNIQNCLTRIKDVTKFNPSSWRCCSITVSNEVINVEGLTKKTQAVTPVPLCGIIGSPVSGFSKFLDSLPACRSGRQAD
ncbi:MAG: hypothetical protein C0417_12335 [Chlorobiaceae bacterium]|nr:hypothetical protein [Chlorobiaceae bacterium]